MVLSIDLEFSDKEWTNCRKLSGRVRNWTVKVYSDAGVAFSELPPPPPPIGFPDYFTGFAPDFDHFYGISMKIP